MFKKILSVVIILLLLLTFSFGYISDNNITDDDNFIIDVEGMNSLTSTLLNSFNNYANDIKNNTMSQYLEVMKYFSIIGEEFTSINVNKVQDIFNKTNILSFFQGLLSLILAPFYVLYSSAMLIFNIIFLSSKLIVNLVLTCIQLGGVLS